jgi:hypothetical protein
MKQQITTFVANTFWERSYSMALEKFLEAKLRAKPVLSSMEMGEVIEQSTVFAAAASENRRKVEKAYRESKLPKTPPKGPKTPNEDDDDGSGASKGQAVGAETW